MLLADVTVVAVNSMISVRKYIKLTKNFNFINLYLVFFVNRQEYIKKVKGQYKRVPKNLLNFG